MRINYSLVSREALGFKHSAAAAREAWIAALKSGDYEQGTRRLQYKTDNSEDRYCCLGVAAELFMQMEQPSLLMARWEVAYDGTEILKYYDLSRGTPAALNEEGKAELSEGGVFGEFTVLPKIVGRWLGLADNRLDGTGNILATGDKEITPATANDEGHATFAEIAAMLENPECGLFLSAK